MELLGRIMVPIAALSGVFIGYHGGHAVATKRCHAREQRIEADLDELRRMSAKLDVREAEIKQREDDYAAICKEWDEMEGHAGI